MLPAPDPNEPREPEGLHLPFPTAVFLCGSPGPDADRVADRMLDWRPGMLIVARP